MFMVQRIHTIVIGIHNKIAWIILGAILLALGAHLTLFLLYATPVNSNNDSAATGLLWGQMARNVGGQWFRFVSVVCGLAAAFHAARLATRWSKDDLTGAALPLGFLLFPPAIYFFTQPTPYAVIALLTVIGFDMATACPYRFRRSNLICVGIVSLVLVALDTSSAGIAAGLLAMVLMRNEATIQLRVILGVIMLIVLSVSLTKSPASFTYAFGSPDVQFMANNSPFIAYAMLWVALGFALVALFASKGLRDVLSPQGLRRSIQVLGIFFVALMWLWYQFRSSPADVLAALSGLLALGVLAVLPMVIWIRRVMPQLRSLLVWILLPVVMYSCFWVVLGPINLNSFPYDQLKMPASSGRP